MDSDEELGEVPTYRGIPATMILINLLEDNNVVELALDATCRLYRQYLRSGSGQLLGVYLYGVDDKNTAQSLIESPGVKEIIPFSLPALLEFKRLKSLDIHIYKKAKELKLSDVLWHCSKTFANCKKQISSYKVILLTQLKQTPIVADQTPTLKRVRDLTDSNVDLVILNIAQTDYNIDSFYINFLKEAYKGQDPVLPEPIFDSLEIEKIMYKESHRRLAVSNLSFEIAEGFSISVGVYSLIKKAGYNHHRKINLDRENNAVVTNVTKMTKVTTESKDSPSKELPLLNSELLFYQEYGGERVEFSTDEIKSMKNPFGPPMLRLLGFKPVGNICKEKWYLKMSYFLFPSENNIEGSTVAFNSMHKACSDLNMVAICVLCTRVNARPTIVALNPCKNPNGLDVAIGFDVIHIPFVENIRDLNIEDEDESSIEPAHKVVMKDLLNSIQFDYKPDMFANPKLQSEYRAIEAIALEEEDIEPFVDTTKPNSIYFQNLKENLFEEMFGPFGELATKRTASKTASEGSKKSKLDIDLGLFRERLSKNQIEKYTVSQLKEILQFNSIDGLPALTGLKKAELVNLVYNHCK
ncbi:ATP-dependent DNA helicase ku70 [Pieris rapae]|uniref:ATP-dependent DNA helicase ku70 n=1 Tax=Pieris rapae TaxID=64459 RepID=UPI001E27A83A|nr:ATP-dependent DNA helicase ku70 [Pieris rapae]